MKSRLADFLMFVFLLALMSIGYIVHEIQADEREIRLGSNPGTVEIGLIRLLDLYGVDTKNEYLPLSDWSVNHPERLGNDQWFLTVSSSFGCPQTGSIGDAQKYIQIQLVAKKEYGIWEIVQIVDTAQLIWQNDSRLRASGRITIGRTVLQFVAFTNEMPSKCPIQSGVRVEVFR